MLHRHLKNSLRQRNTQRNVFLLLVKKPQFIFSKNQKASLIGIVSAIEQTNRDVDVQSQLMSKVPEPDISSDSRERCRRRGVAQEDTSVIRRPEPSTRDVTHEESAADESTVIASN